MKLLHVSDWHLGRTTYNASRAPDHDEVIAEMLDIARREAPDLVLHTGDLFESVRPAYEDMDRGIRALQELARVAPVVVLCGNHDSPPLFRLFTKLMGPASNIRFVDRPLAADDGGVTTYPTARGETLRLATLPFVHANRMVPAFEKPETWMQSYADRIQLIQQNLADGLLEGADLTTDVLVYAAHLHVAGATFSRSERPIHITDTYASRSEHVPKVSYAAFGHIHKPQALPQNEKGWYAGSPIALDFGEVGEQKMVIVVEAQPGRPPEIRPVALAGGRPLRRIDGTLESIATLAPGVGRALCLVTVQTETPMADLSEKVRALLPDATLLQVMESCAAKQAVALKKEDALSAEPTFEELFREYLSETGTKGAPVDRVMATFATLLAAVEHEERPAFAEEGLAGDLLVGVVGSGAGAVVASGGIAEGIGAGGAARGGTLASDTLASEAADGPGAASGANADQPDDGQNEATDATAEAAAETPRTPPKPKRGRKKVAS